MLNELTNLGLMLTAMGVGAFFWLFETLTGIQLFGVDPS